MKMNNIIMDKAAEYAFLKLKMLNTMHINSQLVRKVCILKDHIYDLKIPKQFRFDIISPKFGSPYFILYNRKPTIIIETIKQLHLCGIGVNLYQL